MFSTPKMPIWGRKEDVKGSFAIQTDSSKSGDTLSQICCHKTYRTRRYRLTCLPFNFAALNLDRAHCQGYPITSISQRSPMIFGVCLWTQITSRCNARFCLRLIQQGKPPVRHNGSVLSTQLLTTEYTGFEGKVRASDRNRRCSAYLWFM